MISPIVTVLRLRYEYKSKRPYYNSDEVCLDGEPRSVSLQVEALSVHPGERVILAGSNGAGKSTLLSILGGRKLVTDGTAEISGRSCFDDCELSKYVCYLGDWWNSDFFLDVTVRKFLGEELCRSPRCVEIAEILRVNMDWRISQLSDGQRRRCQILASLTASESFAVYLLDEVTSDLDILSREALLGWLRLQSERDGAIVMYATHILDGMAEWGTRLLYMQDGTVIKDIPVVPSMDIYGLVRAWMMHE